MLINGKTLEEIKAEYEKAESVGLKCEQEIALVDALMAATSWNPASEMPNQQGSYLVILREGNSLDLTHEHAIQAEWDFWVSRPNIWTIYDAEIPANTDVTGDVIFWREIPDPPEQEADTITPAMEFLAGLNDAAIEARKK